MPDLINSFICVLKILFAYFNLLFISSNLINPTLPIKLTIFLLVSVKFKYATL